MTSVNLSQKMHELSDGMIHQFSATTAGRKRSILEIPAKMRPLAVLIRAQGQALAASPEDEFERRLISGWTQHVSRSAFTLGALA